MNVYDVFLADFHQTFPVDVDVDEHGSSCSLTSTLSSTSTSTSLSSSTSSLRLDSTCIQHFIRRWDTILSNELGPAITTHLRTKHTSIPAIQLHAVVYSVVLRLRLRNLVE
eukprot:265988-Prorocentrum_minimum.AAC.3